MGAETSTEKTVPPWIGQDVEYSPETIQSIKDLANNAHAFLRQHPYYGGKFMLKLDEEQATNLATACMEHDARLAAWFPKLVPRRVHEDEFWSNYFSHVEYLIGVDIGEIKTSITPTQNTVNPSTTTSNTNANRNTTISTGTSDRSGMQASGEPGAGARQIRRRTPGMLELTFHKRPFGIELVRNSNSPSSFPLVHSVGDTKTRARGLTPGHLLVKVNGRSVEAEPIDGLLHHLKTHPLPMTLAFLLPNPDTPTGRHLTTAENPKPLALSTSSNYTSPAAGSQEANDSRVDTQYPPHSKPEEKGRLGNVVPYLLAGEGFQITLPQEPTLSARQIRTPVRWGILGCGRICQESSGLALANCRGSELEAAMRRDSDRAYSFAKRFRCKATTSAHDLIHDPHVSAVYIATPPGPRPSLALLACKAGKPCLLEAPIARSYYEARALRDAFATAGVPLFVAHARRAHPRVRAAGRIIQAGHMLGDLTSVTYNLTRRDMVPPPRGVRDNSAARLGWLIKPEMSGGGLFVHYGPHALDLIDHLLGPLSRAAGEASRRAGLPRGSVETSVVMTFRAGGGKGNATGASTHQGGGYVVGAGGVPGTAVFNFAGAIEEDRLCITGTRGRLEMSVFGDDPPLLTTAAGERINFPFPAPKVSHSPLIQRVVDYLLGCPMTEELRHSADSAVRIAGVMDAVLRSFYRARDDHFWRRRETWL
ncbi:hypothetical protein AAMO2058_000362100 [Amorphochlora amoebiformis]|uniref:BSD domain-containing protein n=1 Tax=Amorphochlora amoebiformis TaxID=1561963 RepID=A0A7S0H6T4_9EUKA|mmetsp:Transcript_7402/g.11467  ORF Transcript_7402/g.11467 Transcript_7402/m.11467 type:complete len:707 (+) Transcript_7402:39-2159(+)